MAFLSQCMLGRGLGMCRLAYPLCRKGRTNDNQTKAVRIMNAQTKQRPALGQTVSASDRLWRRIETKPAKYGNHYFKVWRRYGDNPVFKAQPVSGIYIGFRTYVNGRREWDSDDGYIFYPESYHEVWLIVPSERKNPVAVLPSDVSIDPR